MKEKIAINTLATFATLTISASSTDPFFHGEYADGEQIVFQLLATVLKMGMKIG